MLNQKTEEVKMKHPKIIEWDIETSLMEVYKFDRYPDWIPHQNIKEDWFIICIAWKEVGKAKVHCIDITQDKKRFKKNHKDDYFVINAMHDVIKDADLVIHKNGDRFDMPKFNSRVIFHNLEPLPKIPSLDIEKELKRVAKFSSHAEGYLGRFLGLGDKDKTDLELWRDCTSGDIKAIRRMAKYCKQDVKLMHDLYLRIEKYFRPVSVLWKFFDDISCPFCGSHNFQSRGEYRTKVSIFQRFRCSECFKWFKERKSQIRKSTYTSI